MLKFLERLNFSVQQTACIANAVMQAMACITNVVMQAIACITNAVMQAMAALLIERCFLYNDIQSISTEHEVRDLSLRINCLGMKCAVFSNIFLLFAPKES